MCRAALAVLFVYKAVISPLLPKACRFLPTCSSVSVANQFAPPVLCHVLLSFCLLSLLSSVSGSAVPGARGL